MTKQQKIRERAIKSLMAYKGYDRVPTEYIIDHVFADLHSQRVVIWVDRELPYIPLRLNKLITSAVIDYKKKMHKAGFVAWEPLIEEGK